MKNKQIQEERVKGYFIQAATEILRGEGVSILSVRNVAEKAGYSYATLYNYFKDINELLAICIDNFIIECKEHIQSEIKGIPIGLPRIQKSIQSYVKYFVQYPGIFEIFYITQLRSSKSSKAIICLLDEICADDWEYLRDKKDYNTRSLDLKKDSIKYIITGLLVLYNNRRYPEDYATFQDTMNAQIDKVLINE